LTEQAFGEIVVGYDATSTSRDALALASVLAEVTGAELLVTRIYHVPFSEWRLPPEAEQLRDDLAADAAADVEEARSYIAGDLNVRFCAYEAPSAVEGLHNFAESESADLIVVGTTHRGTRARATIGGVAERLLHGAPCAVAVAPPELAGEEGRGLRTIGVGYDASPESRQALDAASALAVMANATVHVIGIFEHAPNHSYGYGSMIAAYPNLELDAKAAFETDVREAADSLPDELRALVVLELGLAADVIRERAERLDLLVVGSRGYGPLRRVLLGSVAAQLAHTSPCPLLVTPRGAA
jgi:nucleotide-binding universal stress UspA family protein